MAEEIMQQEQETTQQEQSLEQLLAGSPALKSQFDEMMLNQRQAWAQEAQAQQSEAEKLKNMSAEQRERYQFTKDKEKFEKDKADFAAQQLRQTMGGELQKLGYSAEFASFITGKDAEESMKNLNTFHNMVRAEVQKGLNGIMRGKAVPKEAIAPNMPLTRESLKNMSPKEIVEAYNSGRLNNLM